MSDVTDTEIPASTATAASVAVGGTATGRVEASGDQNWFRVELVAGTTYLIEQRGVIGFLDDPWLIPDGTTHFSRYGWDEDWRGEDLPDHGTLVTPLIRGIRDVDGKLIAGTAQTDLLTLWLHHSSGNESKPYYVGRVEFTPEETDTYYIVAGAHTGYIGTYEVSVEEVLVRFPSQDFNTLNDAGNKGPQDIWSDGVTMWVGDFADVKLYAYARSTKARDSDNDIDVSADFGLLRGPFGIWSDGTTMWVADTNTDTLLAYKLTPAADIGARDSGKDIALTSVNSSPAGIWADGTTMWVTDADDKRLYAYNLSTKARDSDKEIALTSGEGLNWGIWSDGTTMWVTDADDGKLYAYNLSTKARDSDKEIALTSDNGSARGIWSDGETMWVADSNQDKIYAYSIPARFFQ